MADPQDSFLRNELILARAEAQALIHELTTLYLDLVSAKGAYSGSKHDIMNLFHLLRVMV